MSEKVVLDGNHLTIDEVVAVARFDAPVEIAPEAVEAVNKSREIVETIQKSGEPAYGINTGFGSLQKVSVSDEETVQLQENLIRTHSSGFGEPFPRDVVRAIMLVRVNSLLKGFSGIRLSTVKALLDLINHKVHPHIPEKGSLGASGDLAPLSHMVLPMLGLGRAYYDGELMSGKEALDKAGLKPIQLASKEGLALINGTTVLTAVGALATYDAIALAKLSDVAGALSIEAHGGLTDAFVPEIHEIRAQPGQMATAKNMRALLEGSGNTTHSEPGHVQDAYTLRCIPQIQGASKDGIEYVRQKVEIEINSVTDNPIILPDGRVISGGNFHGEPMAQPFDFLGIAAAEIGNVSERRIERLVNNQLSGLPSFLVKNPGLNSGYMITQYAAAALASENKVLAHPASVDSIPSCENQEDFVSMGTIAARHAAEIVNNAKRIVATEIMAACQAIDLKGVEDKLGKGGRIAYDYVREHAEFIENDKDIEIYDEINKVSALVDDHSLVEKVLKDIELDLA